MVQRAKRARVKFSTRASAAMARGKGASRQRAGSPLLRGLRSGHQAFRASGAPGSKAPGAPAIRASGTQWLPAPVIRGSVAPGSRLRSSGLPLLRGLGSGAQALSSSGLQVPELRHSCTQALMRSGLRHSGTQVLRCSGAEGNKKLPFPVRMYGGEEQLFGALGLCIPPANDDNGGGTGGHKEGAQQSRQQLPGGETRCSQLAIGCPGCSGCCSGSCSGCVGSGVDG